MVIQNKSISGRKGGGKGGEDSSIHTPIEYPNTLRSKATAYVLDLYSEGETGGLYNGLKSVYYNNLPVQNDDDTFNYTGVTVHERKGTPNQTAIPLINDIEREQAVGVKVTTDQPISFTHTDSLTDSIIVTVRIPRLLYQQNNGDLVGSSVSFEIQLQSDSGSFETVVTDTISGKTVAPYERSYDITLTGNPPWISRVVRISPDDDSAQQQNELYYSRVTEVIKVKLTYPHSALIASIVDPSAFDDRVPSRAFDVWGINIQIPSNYDPETREYTGIWDGTFKLGITENPAWWFYDLYTNKRYGLGQFIDPSYVDKWSLYHIATVCDELVPDGDGGMEPRFRFNLQINVQRDAFKIIQALASVFRGMVFTGAGYITAITDMPEDAALLVTPANVVGGLFTYSGTGLRSEYSVAHVSYNDPDDNMKVTITSVEDEDLIQKLGYKPTSIVAYGCESESQAIRTGRYLLESQKISESVTYIAGLDHATILPGKIVKIQDPFYAGVDFSGRVLGGSTGSVVKIDRPVDLDLVTYGYTFLIMYKSIILQNIQVSVDESDNSLNSSTYDFTTSNLEPGDVVSLAGFVNVVNNSIFRIVSVSTSKIQVAGSVTTESVATVLFESVKVIEKPILDAYISGNYQVVQLQEPLMVNPTAGSVWMISSNSVEPRMFRVLSISTVPETETQFEIQAILHDPNMIDRIEQDIVLTEPTYTLLQSGPLLPPTGLSTELYVSKYDTAIYTNVIVSWSPSIDSRVSLYQLMVLTPATGFYEHVDFTQGASIVIENVLQGVYKFRVRSLNSLGRTSEWVEIEVLLTGQPIGVVGGFRASVLGDQVHLHWIKPSDLNLSYYQLKFTLDVSNPSWDSSVDLLTNISQDTVSVVVPAMMGSYLLKAVDIAGIYSLDAAVVTLLNPGINVYNVVVQEQDHPTFSGTTDDTVILSNSVRLASSNVMADWTTLASVTTLRGYGMKESGTYLFSQTIDLGEKYTSRVDVRLKVSANNLLNVMSSWATLASVGVLSGISGNEYSVLVYYRSTDDDPSGTPTWSDWILFSIGDYTARAYQFRLTLMTTILEVTPVIEEFTVSVDMPDRIVGDNDVLGEIGGKTITFSPKFREKPVISITGQDMVSGDRVVFSATREQLDVEFFTSGGTSVARTFDYIAKGFGSEVV